jgi:energy-coupling factor transporter ATP-binding protein EcfA2
MTRSPYKLLDYYRFEDVDLFFGREEETRKMVGEILSGRLLVLFSPSGSGKTSLMNAGVRPQLEEMGYKTIYPRMEDEPIISLCRAVAESLDLPDCQEKEELYEYLKKAAQTADQPLVIFLDQFEEFFIVFKYEKEVRQKFIEQVALIKYDDELPVSLVLSLREDYFANLHEFREAIPSIFQNNAHIRLEPFSDEAFDIGDLADLPGMFASYQGKDFSDLNTYVNEVKKRRNSS